MNLQVYKKMTTFIVRPLQNNALPIDLAHSINIPVSLEDPSTTYVNSFPIRQPTTG